jgi:hypothetical protein
MIMKRKPGHSYDPAPQARGYFGSPETCMEMVNRFGTYNIQPTADADNLFPAIAQGFPRHLNNEADQPKK